jgi:hypothetical protein
MAPRNALYGKMRGKGIKGRLLQAVMSTYSDSSVQVKIGGKLSYPIKFQNSIKQGSVLSPVLFVIFIDDLLDALDKTKGNTGLLFMDDLATVTGTSEAVNMAHATIIEWCATWEATVNMTKLQILHKRMKTEIQELIKSSEMKEDDITVAALTYLGIAILKQAGSPEGWDAHSKKRGEKMLAAFYLAGRKGMSWHPRAALTGHKLFQCILDKIGLYGAEIWDQSESQTKQLDKQRAQILKATMGLHPSTPTKWVLWDNNTLPSYIAIDAKKAVALRAWKEKEAQGHLIPPYITGITTAALDRLGYKKSKWITTPLDQFPPKPKWGKMVQNWAKTCATLDFQDWWQSADDNNELSNEVDYLALKEIWGDTEESITEIREYLGNAMSLFMRARANSVGVRCDNTTRNQAQVPAHAKRCRQCGAPRETMTHVWLHCPSHELHREPMREAIRAMPQKEQAYWVKKGEDDKNFVETMLQDPSHHITKIAIQCLQNMLNNLDPHNRSN